MDTPRLTSLLDPALVGAGAGLLGAVVRATHPRRRRLHWALVWDMLGAGGLGLVVMTAAPGFGIEDMRLAFALAFAAGLLGQAAAEDLVVSWVRRQKLKDFP